MSNGYIIYCMGLFNNYVTLKLPFLTNLLPPLSRFVTFVHENSFALRHAQQKHPNPFPIKNEILGFKKDRSRSKEISFIFHMFVFSTEYQEHKKENMFKKQNISLLSVTCPNWF